MPEDLAAKATKVTAAGGYIHVETYCRVSSDDEWTKMTDTDRNLQAGEMLCALGSLASDERPSIPQGTLIELRCRYFCSQPETDDIVSDWSETVSFAADDIKLIEKETAADTTAPSETQTTASSSAAQTETATDITARNETETDESASADTAVTTGSSISTNTEKANDKCQICGFCPRPLGLCIFIWLIIIIAAVAATIIIIKSKNKNKNK